MELTLEDFQEASRKRVIAPGRKPKPYSVEQRAFAVDYAQQEMAKGTSKSAVLQALGISYGALSKWQSPEKESEKGFRRVSVKASDVVGQVNVVTPSGYRVEGLSLESLATLLKKLG